MALFLHINWHKWLKNLADRRAMINRKNPRQLSIEEFKLPFAEELDSTNRGVRLAGAMPWEALTEVYNKVLSLTTGRPGVECTSCCRSIDNKAYVEPDR